jgi:sugar/nucleoside kinase (ribokinase family)
MAEAGRRGIVCAGTLCVDRVKRIDRWPAEETLAEIDGEAHQGGGSAFNLAVDVRRLAPTIPVEVLGLVGEDADGALIRKNLEAHGVDVGGVRATGEAATAYTDVMTDRRTGRRTFFFHQGASALLTPDHLDLGRATGRILHLGIVGVHRLMDRPWRGAANGWVAVLRQARALGLETNLELASLAPERIVGPGRACLPWLDFLVINDLEAGAVADIATVRDGETDVPASLRAAHLCLEQGAMRLVVVHFPKGAVAVTRDGTTHAQPSVRVPENAILGSVGAGDAFAAGVLVALHERRGIEEALALGHAAAAASLRAVTTVDAVESADACLALARRWGWRDPLLA